MDGIIDDVIGCEKRTFRSEEILKVSWLDAGEKIHCSENCNCYSWSALE